MESIQNRCLYKPTLIKTMKYMVPCTRICPKQIQNNKNDSNNIEPVICEHSHYCFLLYKNELANNKDRKF